MRRNIMTVVGIIALCVLAVVGEVNAMQRDIGKHHNKVLPIEVRFDAAGHAVLP